MAITNTPAYPIPGEEVTLSMSGGTGTRVDWEITSVPPTSAVELGKLFDVAGDPTDVFTPDVPGEYGVKAYDIKETGVAPPRFRDDPIGIPGTRVLGTQTGTVHVAAAMSLPITTAAGGHGARLELRIVDDNVRAASLLDPLTEISRTAILDSGVVTALDALVDELVEDVGNDFVEGVTSLREEFIAHIGFGVGTVHLVPDTVNAPLNYPPNSVDYAIAVLNELFDKMRGHMQPGSSAPRWHTNDDGVNVPLAGRATTLAQGTVLFADLSYRVYERHRVQTNSPLPAVHGAADNTNVVVAAAPLSLLIVALFDTIATLAPTDITGESQGANLAAHRYGFAA